MNFRQAAYGRCADESETGTVIIEVRYADKLTDNEL